MDNDYMKRGYLLPDGCKDLTDVPKYRPKRTKPKPAPPEPLPMIIGEMTVANQMTVRQLATALKQKPYRIIADLLQMRVMATVDQLIKFDVINKVVRKYGYIAKKAST